MNARRVAAAAVAALAITAVPTTAAASGVDDLPQVSDADLASSVHDLTLPVDDIRLRVEELDSTTTKGAETVVSLRSDILFAFGRADLPPSAGERIRQVLAGLRQGARLKVYGHTDSVGDDARNLALSRDRANAVAAVVHRVRPDLKLDVRGFGERQPVEPNTKGGKDNPDGRAANRRVELRHSR